MPDWQWIEERPEGGQPGQAMQKLMRNEMDAAALLAREVVQNSWDAAQPLRSEPGHEFSLTFRFREMEGKERADFIEGFRLNSLAERFKSLGPKAVGLKDENCLADLLNGDSPLKVLELADRGSHGLYGHPKLQRDSHLYKALYTIAVTSKTSGEGGGGSYGFGKSAFIAASRIRAVFAYSCFRPFLLDGGTMEDPVTRRAIGWVWWENHRGMSRRNRDEYCEGRAQLGVVHRPSSGSGVEVEPFEDQLADEMARRIGLELRSANNVTDLGTSLVLVDPTVDPLALVGQLEKWWWPALCDDLMDIRVVDYAGNILVPKPRLRSDLRVFLSAYEIATNPTDARLPDNQRKESSRHGVIGLVAQDGSGATQSDDAAEEAGAFDVTELDPLTPSVALIRKPRMVIAYQTNMHRKRVSIRGVFVANDAADELLRETEPATHNAWERSPHDDVRKEATAAAVVVDKDIRAAANKFARELAPPPANERVALAAFSRFFGKFVSDTVGPPPKPANDSLPVRVRIEQDIQDHEGQLILVATIKVDLDPESSTDRLQVIFRPSYRLVQDEQSPGDNIPVHLKQVSPRRSFRYNQVDQGYVGELEKGQLVKLRVESDPYDELRTGKLIVEFSSVDEAANYGSD